MPESNENIQIGDKTIGLDTVIKINIKTLLILLGVIIPTITGLYVRLEGKVSDLESKITTMDQKILVIGVNMDNSSKIQENIQKNVDRLITKLIPEAVPNLNIHVENTNPDKIKVQ